MNYLWTFIPGCFAMVGLAFITQGLFFLRGQNRTFISSIEVDVEVISLRPFHNSDTGSDAYLAEYEVISGPYSGTRHLTQYPANPPLHDLGDRPTRAVRSAHRHHQNTQTADLNQWWLVHISRNGQRHFARRRWHLVPDKHAVGPSLSCYLNSPGVAPLCRHTTLAPHNPLMPITLTCQRARCFGHSHR